jgi:DNA-damage-inducible protein J
MASDGIVRVRIDETIREQASQALADMGLSVSDAVRMLLVRVAREKAMPFEVRVPRDEIRTVEELRAALREGIDSGTAGEWNAEDFLKEAHQRADQRRQNT